MELLSAWISAYGRGALHTDPAADATCYVVLPDQFTYNMLGDLTNMHVLIYYNIMPAAY